MKLLSLSGLHAGRVAIAGSELPSRTLVGSGGRDGMDNPSTLEGRRPLDLAGVPRPTTLQRDYPPESSQFGYAPAHHPLR